MGQASCYLPKYMVDPKICFYFPQFLLIYQQKQTKKVETFGVLAENAYFCSANRKSFNQL